VYSSPAVSEGTVYFGSAHGYFYAVDAEAGKHRWRFKAGDWIESSPAIANGTAYFGCWDAYLYAVDIKNGRENGSSRPDTEFFRRRP
jgi:eukaryotic-like serine/threonine-protein kinase